MQKSLAQLDLLQEMVNFMDRNTNGVQQYYQTIRDRLANYIKSDYLANSETLLLYADDILGEMCPEEINIAKEPYIETSSSYRKVNDGITNISTVVEENAQGVSSATENVSNLANSILCIRQMAMENVNSSNQLMNEVNRFQKI